MASLVDIVVGLAVAALVAWFIFKNYFAEEAPDSYSVGDAYGKRSGAVGDTRDIVGVVEATGKDFVIFFGSQTGTSEDFASKLAKELHSKLGISSMTADLDDYDYENLDQFPEDKVVIFLMSSYGEGEPTDNAANFWSFISESPCFSNGGTTLENLHFVVFGLGNSTYEIFNGISRALNKQLSSLGAVAAGPYGEADDGKGTTEEDFLAWKEELFEALKKTRGVKERDFVYEPSFEVKEADGSEIPYNGEHTPKHLSGNASAPWTHLNPKYAKVLFAKELFADPDRHCVHMEFDASELRYKTGDHLAFWPQNESEEVSRFLHAFGLSGKAVISISPLDPTVEVPIPQPATWDAIARHYLEINGPVSRQILQSFIGFAPEEVRPELSRLASDKDVFHDDVTAKCLNLSSLLLSLSGGKAWKNVPASLLIEGIPRLQPRYYSISSSSLETPDVISTTGVVEQVKFGDWQLNGVATNNMLAILNESSQKTHDLKGPRGAYAASGSLSVPAHVRHSSFKLPISSKKPIIMIGPGTGVAPFRGFIHERAKQARDGKEVGKALLFFGCRSRHSDYLYGDEWPAYSSESTVDKIDGPFTESDFLEVVTAFSREQDAKLYVQDRLREKAGLVNELLLKGASFYICGDASRMARDVHATLLDILKEERGITQEQADAVVRKMRNRELLQEDVW